MTLIENVQIILTRLSPHGWRKLLLKVTNGELDIESKKLAAELAKPLAQINREIKGFIDFASHGVRAIEPGWPALSLLYHALASPAVTEGITEYPTLSDLDIIENYIFSLSKISKNNLKDFAIVVFACEYRPVNDTVQQKHADFCFSRIGIARTGTAQAMWDPPRRHFQPLVENKLEAFRVLPARYAAYLAKRFAGNKESIGPMRFQEGDEHRTFWVPVHKLFNGPECIEGLDLNLNFEAHHVHEKLRKFHEVLNARGYDTGWKEPDIDQPPFVLTEGIAEFSKEMIGVLIPVPHSNLVEGASYNNKPLAFNFLKDFHGVSKGLLKTLGSSLWMWPVENARLGPEFINVRHEILPDGQEVDLSQTENVDQRVKAGGYTPRHFIDYTGDGWIQARCPELESLRNISAYSLVTPPSFFPYCNQRELMDWCIKELPDDLGAGIWAEPPKVLCDRRYAANITLKEAGFTLEDDTVPAIVSLQYQVTAGGPPALRPLLYNDILRPSYLPDAAAGIFDPGWDSTISHGDDRKSLFLENYGLGTPFLEDAKLCSAFGSFWPAVAPDSTREFEPLGGWPTVVPLTDEEIGLNGGVAWDGVEGPRLVKEQGKRIVVCSSIDHTDYINNHLTAHFTSKINADEYKNRVLAMALAYWTLGIDNREYVKKYKDRLKALGHIIEAKARWSVLSFQKLNQKNEELRKAEKECSVSLGAHTIYRFEIYRHGAQHKDPANVKKRHVEVLELVTMYLDFETILFKSESNPWRSLTYLRSGGRPCPP
ncbi:MAG: hypothetical protein C5B54_03605 [Acidobacteria bacterium]|nr:MAG: hypothetical protein C5B54_03605 [Acidobacteriota bacterium]